MPAPRPLQWLYDLCDDVAALKADIQQLVWPTLAGIPVALTRLETLIMTTADDLIARLGAATDEIANDLTSLRSQVAAAVADKDQAVQDAVNAALSGFDAPIARLEALGADPADPVPAPDPAPSGGDPAAGGDVTA